MSTVAGLALALLSTAALSYGFYLQHAASGQLPALALRHPVRSLSSLFSNWRWLAGHRHIYRGNGSRGGEPV
jgi:hypothetical protein